MASKTVYFNKHIYYYNPAIERVCRVYNQQTNKPLTVFNMVYECLNGQPLKFGKRPLEKSPDIIVDQIVADTNVDESTLIHRQDIANTMLVKKVTGEDSMRLEQSDIDDIKNLARARYHVEPNQFTQLCKVLDNETSHLEEMYFTQSKEYYHLDYERLDREMKEFYEPKSGAPSAKDRMIMRQFTIDAVQALYAHDPEHPSVVGYTKKGEDFPLKEETKRHKKEEQEDGTTGTTKEKARKTKKN